METLSEQGLDISLAGTESAAMAFCKKESFGAIFIDLKLTPPSDPAISEVSPNYQGIQLGSRIRDMDTDVLIVMYSADIELKRESDFKFYDDCLASGADKVISREWMVSAAPVLIAKQISAWRQECLAKRRGNVDFSHSSNIHMKAMIEKLGGQSVLHDILRHTLPELASHAVEPVSGGYSGALVISVESKSTADGPADAWNFIKISKSEFSLHDELRRRPYQGTVLDTRSVTPRIQASKKIHDWHAFSVAAVRNAGSLEEFVSSRTLNARNKSPLKKLVSTLLIQPASISRIENSTEPKRALLFRYVFLAEVLDSLDDIMRFSKTQYDIVVPKVDDVHRFVSGLGEGYFPLGLNNTRVASLHGDFHCRNVLLPKNGEAVLIDFGRADIYPRLFDIANLEVDLVVRVLGNDSGDSWNTGNLELWTTDLQSYWPLSSDESRPEDCISYLRSRLHEALRNDIESVSKREYAEALVFHLLRYVRFPSIPFPKRALCVEWITSLLKQFGISAR